MSGNIGARFVDSSMRSARPAAVVRRVCTAAAVLLFGGCVESAPDSGVNTHGINDTTVAASGSTAAVGSVVAGSLAAKSAATVSSPSTSSSRIRCVVASVTDGDSMRCNDQGRVRLLLLDAPEMSQTPFGTQSRDALRSLINQGDTVWLEYDVQREDQYGRTLAHVWTAPDRGTHVNLAQAQGGWAVAVVFQPNVRYIEAIRRAVATARQQKRGLWADDRYSCEPIEHKRGNC